LEESLIAHFVLLVKPRQRKPGKLVKLATSRAKTNADLATRFPTDLAAAIPYEEFPEFLRIPSMPSPS
jgi:hypothetical protein